MPIAADLPDDIEALKQLVAARRAERDIFKVERDVIATERDVAVAERDRWRPPQPPPIMVDSSDAFTDTQKKRVRTTIEKENDRLAKGGRLTILSLNPAGAWEPIEHVSVCNPGTAAGVLGVQRPVDRGLNAHSSCAKSLL